MRFSMDHFFDVIENQDGEMVQDILSFSWKQFPDFLEKQDVYGHLISGGGGAAPDLISYHEYQEHQYWWILCLANKLSDPFNDMEAGINLVIPLLSQIETYYQSLKTRTPGNQLVVF